jgi:phospholipase/carboxylesterase
MKLQHPISRRDLLRVGGAGFAAALAACIGSPAGPVEPAPRKARLAARPRVTPLTSLDPGLRPLALGSGKDGLLYVPAGCAGGQPVPLVLMLHGAGGNSTNASRVLRPFADQADFLVVAPDSRGRTWDAIFGEFGPDVEFIDRALTKIFARYPVDLHHVAVAGFSDGATYALALARANGDLFTHGIAFSPGFLIPVIPRKRPRLFISHGTRDRVLPIDVSSRAIVTDLRKDGYRIEYREFDGDHQIPRDVARDAVLWYLAASKFPPSRVLSGCSST